MIRNRNDIMRKKLRLAFSIGESMLTASLVWLMTNLPRLVYGSIEPYESFIPLTFLVIGLVFVVLFFDLR